MMFLAEISTDQFRDAYKKRHNPRNRKILDLLEHFLSSGYVVAQVNTFFEEYKSPASAYSGIKNAINRERMGNKVAACMRNKQIYLYRVDMIKGLD